MPASNYCRESNPAAETAHKMKYDGSTCPNCGSENINGDTIDPQGASKAYRNCDCGNCSATWTEELTVTGYDGLEWPGE